LAFSCRKVQGLGMSTFSKILYFRNIKFEDHPCLILDQRLIAVFSGNAFPEFDGLRSVRYGNTGRHYLDYLRTRDRLATRLGTNGKNIEQFCLFLGTT
jgi:hypothetical protein